MGRGASTTQGGPSRSIRTRRRALPARRASSLSDEAREHIHLTAKEGRVWWTRVILCVSSGVDCPRTALRGLGPQVSVCVTRVCIRTCGVREWYFIHYAV